MIVRPLAAGHASFSQHPPVAMVGQSAVVCEGFVHYERDEVLALTRGDRAACRY